MSKQIKQAEYYFITEINEPEDNSLAFELICGVVSEEEEDISIGNLHLGTVRPILMSNDCKYKVKFDSYIAYSVLNESYADSLGDDFTGYNPRIYANSGFLDYIKSETFASKEFPGEFQHYAFLSENHIVNVAAVSEPKIERIK